MESAADLKSVVVKKCSMAGRNRVSIPQKLVEQISRGNCVLLLGSDVDSKGGLDTLVEVLADECNYPPDKTDRSLAAVGRYYQAITNRHQLVVRLREWVGKIGTEPTSLHRGVAKLPVNHIVDFGYSSRMEATLREAGQSYALVVRDHELSYTDHSRTLLVKPYGLADQPDSLVLTEDDHFLFVRSHPLLVDQLRIWAATQVLLWVHVNPFDPYFQRLHRAMTDGISPHHRQEYALVQTQREAESWAGQGSQVLKTEDSASWLGELAQVVAELPPVVVDRLPHHRPVLGRRPYKFLDFYTAEDADLFFGREDWTRKLAGSILAQQLTVLFGRSGVGKTSLLLAGVAPYLEDRGCWVIYVRPGDDPLSAVRMTAEAQLEESDRMALARIPDLGIFIKSAGERRGKTPVIILDQAEECFTALSRRVRDRWVESLAHACRTAPGSVRWVLSLREDFAAELHEWTARVPTLFDHTMWLTQLSRDEARQAIVKPPEQVGIEIETALVEKLLDDLFREGVDPADLQIVCDRLYQSRHAVERITLGDLKNLGGTDQILADYVDFALDQLPEEQRERAIVLLKAMVTGRETKLPFRFGELMRDVGGDPPENRVVLNRLVDARLVRSLEQKEEQRYELAHDVLVEKVRSWIDETERQAKAVQDVLRQEQRAWNRLQVLPEREKIEYIHCQRDNPYLRLDSDDLTLMLHAALREGLDPGYWARRAAEAGVDLQPILIPALESDQEQQRIHALRALAGWSVPQALDALRVGMADGSPRTRVAAHQALYQVGSPQAMAILDTSDELRLVAAGEFTMGGELYSDEKPIHQVTLDAFFVEKYPVTCDKYDRFMAAGGYEDRQYWIEESWLWVQQVNRTRPVFWDEQKWSQPEQPVLGMTWHEALAYARWIGRRLLSEAEWEKAARGTDGRAFPWGNEFDPNLCNTSESTVKRRDMITIKWIQAGGEPAQLGLPKLTLARVVPVGLYSPQGDSPYGVADMAGNIWEWTSSLYMPYPYRTDEGREVIEASGNRVLRGGMWSRGRSRSRCAYRYSSPPARAVYFYAYGCRCGVDAYYGNLE